MNDDSGPCICCGCEDSNPYPADLKKCPACGHVWAFYGLSDGELKALYGEDYFSGEEYLDYAREAPALRRNFRPRLREIIRRHPKGSRLWEIGAAYGFFLELASAHFEVAGCDVSESAAAYASHTLRLDVRTLDYLDYEPDRPFDVLCMWDTVEHLPHPHRYLEKAFADLASGGTLAIATADISAFLPRIRRAKWRIIHPPTHLHYFSRSSMATLLRRIGFHEIHFRRSLIWRHADAVAFRILAHPPTKKSAPIYHSLKNFGLLNFIFPIQTFDLMEVYARKP